MEKKAPYFSVIIPTKDRPEMLSRAVKSVLQQEMKDFELLVIDDHSNYCVEKLLNFFEDSRIRIFQNTKTERSAARNLGIEHSLGRYICFLDDDDEYGQEYLKAFYDYYTLTGKENYILRTGFIQIFYDGRQKKRQNYNVNKHSHPVRFAAEEMCGVWSLAIPAEYLVKDKFPEAYPHWQDTHLILRLFAKFPFHQLENHLYKYHIHEGMGSLLIMNENTIESRLEINIAAIQDVFIKYGALIQPFLASNTLSKLLATKYLQYALSASQKNLRKQTIIFFKKSLKLGIHKSNWKMILKILLFLFRIK